MKYLLPVLALAGLGAAVLVIALDYRPPEESGVTAPTPEAPYTAYVAGVGLLEAATQNIQVGTPVEGVISDVFVEWGQRVQGGDPLFAIDDRDARSRLRSAKAEAAKAEAVLEKSQHDLKPMEGLSEVISHEELTIHRDDVEINRAELELSRARVAEAETEIERRTVRAPIAGRVLRMEARTGEYAAAGGGAEPLIVLGDDDRLNVRVEIDEHDAWRVAPGAKATGFVRGNPKLKIPLEFQRIEPYIAAKRILTDRGAERTDVRVLPVVYGFERGSLPVYAGQELDVFIEAPTASPEGM